MQTQLFSLKQASYIDPLFSSSGFIDTLANVNAGGWLLALNFLALVDLLHQVKIPDILVMDNSGVYNVCKSPFPYS